MAGKLKFPQNIDVFGGRSDAERANSLNGNRFSRVWHGFFEKMSRRMQAAEDVASISTADVGAAGGAYNQTYADQQTALINELKAKVNELLVALEK